MYSYRPNLPKKQYSNLLIGNCGCAVPLLLFHTFQSTWRWITTPLYALHKHMAHAEEVVVQGTDNSQRVLYFVTSLSILTMKRLSPSSVYSCPLAAHLPHSLIYNRL